MIYARCCTGYLLRSRNIFIIKLHKCISNNVKSFYISSIRKRRCDQWSVAPTVFVFDQRKKKRESNALTTKFTIQECHNHAMHAPVYVCVSTVIQADTILMFAVVTGLSHKLNLRSLFAPATEEKGITIYLREIIKLFQYKLQMIRWSDDTSWCIAYGTVIQSQPQAAPHSHCVRSQSEGMETKENGN